MVYIGPTNTLSLTARTRAITGYSSKQNPVDKPVDSTIQVAPVADRRKTRDRRKHQQDALVETRAGDRRTNRRPKIDIII